MRYEVFGIISPRGANTLLGSARSLKAAKALARDCVNSLVYQAFAVVEKDNAKSPAKAIMTGPTRGLHSFELMRAVSLIQYLPDPTQTAEAGVPFWAEDSAFTLSAGA